MLHSLFTQEKERLKGKAKGNANGKGKAKGNREGKGKG